MGTYLRLVDYKTSDEKEYAFLEKEGWFTASDSMFNDSPKKAYLYWLKNRSVFLFEKLQKCYESGGRNKTHNNEKYVRKWWEVSDLKKWQTYENGGDYRKWFGNCMDVVDWSDTAKKDYQSHGGLYNQKYAGKEGISWNLISSSRACFRKKNATTHYSSGSPTIFSDVYEDATVGFLNSMVARYLLNMLNPTMNTTVNDVLVLPINFGNEQAEIDTLAKNNISAAQEEWDEFECSKDFKRHPLI